MPEQPYAEVKDTHAEQLTIQPSSFAVERCAWIYFTGRRKASAHLNVEQAREVRDGLNRFIRDADPATDPVAYNEDDEPVPVPLRTTTPGSPIDKLERNCHRRFEADGTPVDIAWTVRKPKHWWQGYRALLHLRLPATENSPFDSAWMEYSLDAGIAGSLGYTVKARSWLRLTRKMDRAEDEMINEDREDVIDRSTRRYV